MLKNEIKLKIVIFLTVLSYDAVAQGVCDTVQLQFPATMQLSDTLFCDSTSIDSMVISKDVLFGGNEEIKKNGPVNVYDLPYSRSFSSPNKRRLLQNTIALYGGGIVALGVLELLPENTTAWNKEEARRTPFFKRWWNHVKKGPVWDKDNWVFNYVLHPYGGAAYFMSARSQGLNGWQSMLYSFSVSTLFWEYGIEAFMEYPSIQDLVITPVAGSLIGESFYRLKRRIVADDYRLFGSKILGNIVACLIDPVNEFMGIFFGNPCRSGKKKVFSVTSTFAPKSFSMSIAF